jgi:hypothetical protein
MIGPNNDDGAPAFQNLEIDARSCCPEPPRELPRNGAMATSHRGRMALSVVRDIGGARGAAEGEGVDDHVGYKADTAKGRVLVRCSETGYARVQGARSRL